MNKNNLNPINDKKAELLTPLLSDKQSQITEYRIRNSPYNFKSVHPADIEAEVAGGWEIQREGKRKCRLKRDKPHDQRLEDRVWCLLYKMGYQHLNGNRFVIKFKRTDGTTGRKQIDVFACDDEATFVIECKSKAERGRRSLQKDIQETISLQNYIRQSIFKLYNDKPKPKIIWAYATYNIIWSETDAARVGDGKIAIITENELQYFEAFIKHMGPAGKYQVLSEFLKGQKVPGLGDVRLPAVRGKIGGETFYSFVVTPRRLQKIAFINHQALNHPDGRPAYQRMISASRIKEIGKFITHGGYFPTNVLVNFTDSLRFDLISNNENTDPNIKFGWITLPSKYRSAWIIDGQHRLYGYSHLDDKFLDQSLFVLAFEKMGAHKEADLFITINHKQKSVPKSLLDSLLADLRLGDPDPKISLRALSSAVVRAINKDKTSSLSRRFATPGLPPEANQNLTISEAINGLSRSGLIGRVINKNLCPGPMSGATDDQTVDRARKILNTYFDKIREANPERWEAGKTAFITVNPSIRAHLMLIAEIVSFLQHKKGVDFHILNEEKFADYVGDIATPIFEYVGVARDEEIKEKFSRKFGEGGVKEYLFNLFEIVYERHPDFGSDDFRTWVTQKASDKVGEASNFIMRFSEMITNCVINTLKQVHGTQKMESGESAFWEIGVESRRVKDNAYRKQQDDKFERRKPKEAYLDIVDLIEIMKQSSNWPHFEPIFNLPKPKEKKGKKYYLNWMNDFNELRKIAAHKNLLRTYSDEDLEFLDWLRSELEPKLKAELGIDD